MLKNIFTSVLFVAWLLLLPLSASAQTLLPPPAFAPAPSWSANFPIDPGNWPSPEAACQAQHDYSNPNATLLPPTYTGGRTAGCNWLLNANSNTILPALATASCPSGWGLSDPGVCLRSDYAADSRAQCGCGAAPPGGTPQPAVGDPIALNYAALVEDETDYAPAERRFAVERHYYSLGEDYTNIASGQSGEEVRDKALMC